MGGRQHRRDSSWLFAVAGRESKLMGTAGLADNALESPNARVVRMGVEGSRGGEGRGQVAVGHGIGWDVLLTELPLNQTIVGRMR